MWKARGNWFSAAVGTLIKRVCSQQSSSWLPHSLVYFSLFLSFCNTWLTIKWLFQHSLIPLEHGEYHSCIPHNGFSTFCSFNPLPRHSVLACGLAVTYLCSCVRRAQTVDAHRHRMGALRAGLGGPEGLYNLKIFLLLAALTRGLLSLHQGPGWPSLCLYWTSTSSPMRAFLTSIN